MECGGALMRTSWLRQTPPQGATARSQTLLIGLKLCSSSPPSYPVAGSLPQYAPLPLKKHTQTQTPDVWQKHAQNINNFPHKGLMGRCSRRLCHSQKLCWDPLPLTRRSPSRQDKGARFCSGRVCGKCGLLHPAASPAQARPASGDPPVDLKQTTRASVTHVHSTCCGAKPTHMKFQYRPDIYTKPHETSAQT